MRSVRHVVIAVMALALVGAACSSDDGDLQSVRDPQRLMFFELPNDWTVYDQTQLEALPATPFVVQTGEVNLPILSRVVFEGTTAPDGAALADISTSNVPVGSAVVRSISTSQRDQISRFLLAELVLDYHNQPVAQEVLKQDVEVAADFDGVQVVVLYNDGVSQADAGVAMISITDPEVRRMFSIAVGCSLECFGEHQTVITDVIDSWLVNTR